MMYECEVKVTQSCLRKPLLVGRSDRDAGEVHCSSRLWPRLVEGLSEGYGGLQHLVPSVFPGPSSSPTGPSLRELQGLQNEA